MDTENEIKVKAAPSDSAQSSCSKSVRYRYKDFVNCTALRVDTTRHGHTIIRWDDTGEEVSVRLLSNVYTKI